MTAPADRSLRPMRHDPTPSGTIFRVVEIPPESAGTKIDAGATFGQLGSTHQPSAADSAKHPTMHKTNSIDYLVVISGSMHMLMEEGEVELHAGDCIVQRGTNHAWVNRSGKPVPAGGGADRRQTCAMSRIGGATRRCDESRGLGRQMGTRRAPSGRRSRSATATIFTYRQWAARSRAWPATCARYAGRTIGWPSP